LFLTDALLRCSKVFSFLAVEISEANFLFLNIVWHAGLPTQTEKIPLKTPDFSKKSPKNFRLKIL
jgi:hypothetical protein